MACDIRDRHLTPNLGWIYKKSGLLDPYVFIPGSLAALRLSHLKIRGKRGVHYVHGYRELGRMLERFGLDHAPDPEDLDHPPPELPQSQRKSLEDLHAQVFPDGLPRKKARRKDPPAPLVDAAPAAVATPSAVAAKPTLSPTSMESAGNHIAPDSNCLFFSPSLPISKIHSLPPRTVFPSQTPQAHLRR